MYIKESGFYSYFHLSIYTYINYYISIFTAP